MKWWWLVTLVCVVGARGAIILPYAEEFPEEKRAQEAKQLLANLDPRNFSPFGLLQALVDELKAQRSNDETYKRDLELCAHAAYQVLTSAKSMEMWALRMIDSGTKVPSGLLMGNLVDLGQFDECTRVRPEHTNHSFSGQHCLVTIRVAGIVNVKMSGGLTIGDMSGGQDLNLTIAQCLPSVCKSHIIEVGFIRVLKPFNDAINKTGIAFKPVVEQKDCHTADPTPLGPEEWIVLVVILLLIFVSSAGTAIDLKRGLCQKAASMQITPKEQCILAFSAYYNGKKLLSMKRAPDQMPFINGLKFMSICWVLLGHRYKYLISEPVINFLDLPNEIKKYSKMFLLSAPLSVDSFFMVGGLLNMYSFCKIREKKAAYTYKDVLISYAHRYIRLTPAYLVVLAITATWFNRLGDGPYWDRLAGQESDNCRNSGYWNLLYTNNYYPYDYCMMQSWYLAADMQMFWLSPFVMYPLWRWPLAGCGLLAALLVASVVSPFMASFMNNIKMPIPITANNDEIYRTFKYYYFPTHVKFVSYVIGIGAGALLYLHKEGKLNIKLKWWQNMLLWTVGTISMLYALFGGHNVYQMDSPYDKWESAFYMGFFRFFWCVGLAWIIIACAMGYGGPVNTFLSWKVFGPMGRLTYCIYLCHIMVILYKLGTVRVPVYYSDFDQVKQFMGDLIISVFAAAAVSILCESPLMMVEKMVFGAGQKGKHYDTSKVKGGDLEKDGMIEDEKENHRLQNLTSSHS